MELSFLDQTTIWSSPRKSARQIPEMLAKQKIVVGNLGDKCINKQFLGSVTSANYDGQWCMELGLCAAMKPRGHRPQGCFLKADAEALPSPELLPHTNASAFKNVNNHGHKTLSTAFNLPRRPLEPQLIAFELRFPEIS